MKLILAISFVLLCTQAVSQTQERVQNCEGVGCVQVGTNYGTIEIDGGLLQIAINKGIVNITGRPEDIERIADYEIKVTNLEQQISRHLQALQDKESRIFSDTEKLERATRYSSDLIKQINQLEKRIAKLDEQHELTQRIVEAKNRFDVPLIKDFLKQKQKLDDKQSAETAFELAGFQKLDLEYIEAFENYQKAVFLDKNNALYLNEAGIMALELARFDEAEPLMRRALEIDEQSFGEGHPNVAIRLNNLAQLLQATNRLSEAEPLMRRALEIDEQSFGEDHPEVAVKLNNLAQLLQATNRLSEAEPLMRRVVEIFHQFGQLTGHQHPHMEAAVSSYGGLLMETGLSQEEAVVRIQAVLGIEIN